MSHIRPTIIDREAKTLAYTNKGMPNRFILTGRLITVPVGRLIGKADSMRRNFVRNNGYYP
jgi:hypothetical protein